MILEGIYILASRNCWSYGGVGRGGRISFDNFENFLGKNLAESFLNKVEEYNLSEFSEIYRKDLALLCRISLNGSLV